MTYCDHGHNAHMGLWWLHVFFPLFHVFVNEFPICLQTLILTLNMNTCIINVGHKTQANESQTTSHVYKVIFCV